MISITVLSGPDARTVACTHEQALDLDHQQYASGRGPCLEAARQRTPLQAIMSEEHHRWPEFVEAAQRAGIRASLSVPLLIAGVDSEQELVGSLNIYSHTATAFDSFDAELMRLYSVAAGQAISNSSRWQKARETVTQLETALLSRSDIDMAKGALIALHGCDPGRRSTNCRRIPKAQHQTARRRPRNAGPNADEGLATAIQQSTRELAPLMA